MDTGTPPNKLAYNIDETASMLGLGTGTVRQLLATGRLEYTTAGDRILISRQAIDKLLAAPPERQIVDPSDYKRKPRSAVTA
jgi:excisionase family DNA binding protein